MIYIFYIFLDFSKRAAKIKFFPESRKYFFFLSEDMLYGRETVTARETSGMRRAEVSRTPTVSSEVPEAP